MLDPVGLDFVVNAPPYPPQPNYVSLRDDKQDCFRLHGQEYATQISQQRTRTFESFLTWEVSDLISPSELRQLCHYSLKASRKCPFSHLGRQRKVCLTELVKVTMETIDGGVELHLLTTPIICEQLTAQPLALCVDSYKHLSRVAIGRFIRWKRCYGSLSVGRI